MSIIGIVCEFNPFHCGHKHLIDSVKKDGDTLVCVMSGNFVQRGEPAIFPKEIRVAAALKNGADIVTDTNMAKAGINKKVLADLGGQVYCFMADEDVAQEAKTRGVTRATVSMERAAKLEKPVIFAVGNAPTALISLYEMMQEGIFKPAFVIGVPVGFVNVVAAKELIMETDVPYIVNRGRKGGSNIAAAICNGLLYGLRDR
mgnify:CR=1 FL=1